MKTVSPSLVLLVLCLLAVGCQPAKLVQREPYRGQVLRINLQRELGYAPLLLMQRHRRVEQRVPGAVVEWKSIQTSEAVAEALSTGTLDIGVGSIASFLLARERGLPVRILAGISELPLGLTTNRLDARTLHDLGPRDRIAVPMLGGQEHTVLRMAALRELGDWRALDPLVVQRAHPDAFGALMNRRALTAHVAVSPYLERELESPDVRRLLDGVAVMGGPAMSVVAFTTPTVRARQSALIGVFLDALRESSEAAVGDVVQATDLLANLDGAGLTTADLRRYLDRPGLTFSMEVRGLSRLATFMRYTGQLTSVQATWDDLAFADATGS